MGAQDSPPPSYVGECYTKVFTVIRKVFTLRECYTKVFTAIRKVWEYNTKAFTVIRKVCYFKNILLIFQKFSFLKANNMFAITCVSDNSEFDLTLVAISGTEKYR